MRKRKKREKREKMYLEIDLAPLAVCDGTLVQDLQQDHRNILKFGALDTKIALIFGF